MKVGEVYSIKGTALSRGAYKNGESIRKREFSLKVLAISLSEALEKIEKFLRAEGFWEDRGYHKSEYERVDEVARVSFKDAVTVTDVDLA